MLSQPCLVFWTKPPLQYVLSLFLLACLPTARSIQALPTTSPSKPRSVLGSTGDEGRGGSTDPNPAGPRGRRSNGHARQQPARNRSRGSSLRTRPSVIPEGHTVLEFVVIVEELQPSSEVDIIVRKGRPTTRMSSGSGSLPEITESLESKFAPRDEYSNEELAGAMDRLALLALNTVSRAALSLHVLGGIRLDLILCLAWACSRPSPWKSCHTSGTSTGRTTTPQTGSLRTPWTRGR